VEFFNLPRISAHQARPRGSLWTLHEAFAVPKDHATKIVSLQGSFSMFELIENGAGATRQVTIPFEIKDIPLP
jgi:hypothetical protein